MAIPNSVATSSRNATLQATTTPSTNNNLHIIIPLVVAVVLIVALLLVPKNSVLKLPCCISRTTPKDVLPVTEKTQVQQTFVQSHLEDLRNWQKPDITPAHHSQGSVQSEITQIPTLAQPPSTHQPHRHGGLTWQQFKEHYGRYDREARPDYSAPTARVGMGAAYWRKVGEEMEARKTWWEKLRDKCGL